ncbi:RHS repeat protein [Chitinophaga tropicalis]|uniref:YD repeat-containing protein n=1 Tax=Chitinophaga tropicalis TaxID=2683588 RepID=A0A7K1U0S2_9BACT|nr:RHS repeat domain-containing protein [Chitinophaga tropicalis]MVT07967.1 hypothetical protein [Chitinophaga tropicalis]
MNKCTFLFLLCSNVAWAQVDLPTGRAVVSYPLFNYAGEGKLTVSVDLEYTGGNGIKVNDLASNVGLGWTLQAGGVISRSAIGEPDDQVGGKLEGDQYATGRAFSSYSATAMPAKGGWVPMEDYSQPFFRHDASVTDDREMDIFTYSYNGRQGSFVVGTDGSIKVLDNSKLRIEKITENLSASKILTRWSKFIIIDESGIRYTFSEKVLDRIIFYETGAQKKFFLDPAPANLQTYVCGQNYKITNYYAVNNWYLSEISDPLTGKKITYTYEDYELEYISGLQGSYNINILDNGQQQIVAQRITPRYKGIMKRLTAINMPDNNQVVFSYYTAQRADLPGDRALQQISIHRNGQTISGYQFDYQYFCLTDIRDFNYGFTPAEAESSRLCLKAFRKLGRNGVADNPYQFTYNTGSSGVPARNTPAIDHYGYFNGGTYYPFDTDIHHYANVQRLCIPSNRTVIGTISIMGAGTLTGIKYPSGGALTYEYEANTALNGTTSVRTGGIRVKKTIESDGVGASSAVVKEYRYVLEDGQTSGWGYEAPRYLDTAYSRLIIPATGSYRAANMAYAVAVPVTEALFAAYSHNALAGVSRNAVEAGMASTKVSSIYSSLVTSLALIAITYVVQDIFPSSPVNVARTSQVYLSAHPANQNPLPALYSRVEVYEGDVTDNIGKTVYEFTSDKDFAVNFPAQGQVYALKQRSVPWLYGLIKRKLIFNKANEPVHETYNKYSANISSEAVYTYASTSYKPDLYIICPSGQFASNASLVRFRTDKYYPVTANIQLSYTVEKSFTGPDSKVRKVDYEYDPVYYNLRKVSTLNSLNEREEKRIYYPYDYPGIAVTKLMTDNHIYNIPVSSESWLYKTGSEEVMTGAEVTEFMQTASGSIKPGKVYLLATSQPLSKAVTGEFNPSVPVRNATYFKEAVSYTYNSAGYLVSANALNRQTTYIYNDNNEKIIAQAYNAAVADVGYSSFEPGAMGTWDVPSSGSIRVPSVPSGDYCLNMAMGQSITKTGLDADKSYILSYWKKDGSVHISGGVKTNEKEVMVKNGWILVSLNIKQATAITISGSGMLDELRLHPAETLLSSTTYDQYYNIISQTGADHISTYYSYDDLGRLTAVHDADRNLINATEYRYSGN